MRLPLLFTAALTFLPALTLPLATASATPGALAETAAPLVGTYTCQGVEPDGTPYQGIVQITANAGSYDVIWIFGSGQQYHGLGVVNGNVLAVSYFTNRPGVVAYKIENADAEPRLTGQWTVVGAGAVFAETLTRVSREVKRLEPPPQMRRTPAPLLPHLRPA
jgi:hypothetical protein